MSDHGLCLTVLWFLLHICSALFRLSRAAHEGVLGLFTSQRSAGMFGDQRDVKQLLYMICENSAYHTFGNIVYVYIDIISNILKPHEILI